MITGSAVEVGDEVAGGGEHDRVEPSGSVGRPRSEGTSVSLARSPTWMRP